jgi:peroxiredoxin
MSLQLSEMMPLGQSAPFFELRNVVDNKLYNLHQCKGQSGTLVLFICNHCPYVVHVIEELVRVASEFKSRGVNTVAISSNDIINFPFDSPENMKVFAEKHNFDFPYLYDETQKIAKDYLAVCTPDIYLFDSKEKCFYRGRLDESRPGNGKINDGKDLRKALNALVNGEESPKNQFPSQGCNIKWK